jgi:hypothetical protein
MFFEFPSIELLHNLIKSLGILYPTAIPKITFEATPKIHGSNLGITFKKSTQELWCQSRNKIITPSDDLFGFANYIASIKSALIEELNKVELPENKDVLVIWGEWAGEGINKNVAITKVPKQFYIFESAVGDSNTSLPYLELFIFDLLPFNKFKFYDVKNFFYAEITTDFSDEVSIRMLQEILNNWTNAIETTCPVAKAFGITGIGEGVVLREKSTPPLSAFRLKSKGEKHSVNAPKVTNSLAPDVLAGYNEFATYAVTKARIEQALTVLQVDLDIRNTGKVLSWVLSDVEKEEQDTLESNGFTFQQVKPILTASIKTLFKEMLDAQ